MVGKAIYRLVKVRDIVREGIYEYRIDPYIFVKHISETTAYYFDAFYDLLNSLCAFLRRIMI